MLRVCGSFFPVDGTARLGRDRRRSPTNFGALLSGAVHRRCVRCDTCLSPDLPRGPELAARRPTTTLTAYGPRFPDSSHGSFPYAHGFVFSEGFAFAVSCRVIGR